jgi:DedD protein
MQKTPASDQEINFKKRARRRLVGAIALVLLMVIVLPMVLKDRIASDPQEKITITLPNEQQAVIPAAPSDFDSNIVPTEPPATESPKVTESSDTSSSDPEAAAVITSEETPAKEAPKPKDLANHKFYVQIGVFSDEANVKQLQAKLSDLGYKSQTEKISTAKGQKIRLRTQVFGDRNEAAIALENIKDAGLAGMVVSQ